MLRISPLMLLACMIVQATGPWSWAIEPQTPQKSPSQSVSPAAAEISLGDFVIGKPIAFRNLTIFPVASKTPMPEDRYLTLDEGLKSKSIEVYEVGAEPRSERSNTTSSGRRTIQTPLGTVVQRTIDPSEGDSADVNHLMVINLSNKSLYLMPGEIIYGGQQDRCVGEEYLIAPDKKPVKISVYCVEQGRWAARGENQSVQSLRSLADSSGSSVDPQTLQRLSREAQSGKFVAPAGNLDKKGRLAVQGGKGQSEVWNSVGQTNSASGAMNSSNAFTANYTQSDMSKKLRAYTKELQDPVAKHPQVVGAIVAVNGKVEAIDVFHSTPLFKKLWPKLLQSHALDAVAAGKPKLKTTCTIQDAAKFMDDAMHAGKEQKSKTEGGLAVSKRDSKNVISFSAEPSKSGQGMGGFGKGVHSSGYSK
jgi:hypothetical protein